MTATYEDYKNYLKSKGLNNKLVILDQNDKDKICEILEINGTNKNTNGLSLRIKFKETSMISVNIDCLFKLNISDENRIEIPDDTKVTVQKIAPSEMIKTLALKIKYLEFKNGYKFEKPFEILSCHHLYIYISNLNMNIPKENIKFEFTFDYWTSEEYLHNLIMDI